MSQTNHWINVYPVAIKPTGFAQAYPFDSAMPGGQGHPLLNQGHGEGARTFSIQLKNKIQASSHKRHKVSYGEVTKTVIDYEWSSLSATE